MARRIVSVCSLALILALAGCSADDEPTRPDANLAGTTDRCPDVELDCDGVTETDSDTGNGGSPNPDVPGDESDVFSEPPELAPPEAREPNPGCPDYDTARRDYECGDFGRDHNCARDEDCAAGLCQPVFAAGDHVCQCFSQDCARDGDCGPNQACSCAMSAPDHNLAGAPVCGIAGAAPCQSACLPADCRSNDECENGEVCAAYTDFCDRLLGYACWNPLTAECGHGRDCDGLNRHCTFDGEAWVCQPGDGICD